MRQAEEMYRLILDFAENDDRVRCCYLNSTRVDEGYWDQYSDFDIVCVVCDIGSFARDNHWMERFGKILVMQKTSDELQHPYDYDGYENYIYLMQFYDGNRIDLTLVDCRNVGYAINHTDEPRRILVNKDGYDVHDIPYKGFYVIERPCQRAFDENLNEFWWMCISIAKGLCRNEITYAKAMMEHYQFERFYMMLRWLKGVRTDFTAEKTKYAKDIGKYLSKEEYDRFLLSFGDGSADHIWESLMHRCMFFIDISHEVADKMGFVVKENEQDVIKHVIQMKAGQNGKG